MYSVVTSFLNILNNAGVQGICYTNFISYPNPSGEWGSMAYLGEPSDLTPKYNALINFANSPKLQISGLSTSEAAGAASFTITAYNPNGDGVDTDYTGTVKFSSTDPQAILPGDYTFTAADQGVHTFTGIFKSVGTMSMTVTDSTSGINAMKSGIAVHAGQAQKLTISDFAGNVNFGVTNSFKVTLYDAYGNVATGYAGIVQFKSSDPSASLPTNYTFSSADAGASFLHGDTLRVRSADDYCDRHGHAERNFILKHDGEACCRMG